MPAGKSVILVTGGAGYIGSHCLAELLDNGYNAITIDDLSNSRAASLRRVEEITGKKVTFYQCDLLDTETLKKIFTKVRYNSFKTYFGSYINAMKRTMI